MNLIRKISKPWIKIVKHYFYITFEQSISPLFQHLGILNPKPSNQHLSNSQDRDNYVARGQKHTLP